MDKYKPQFRRAYDFMAKYLDAETDEDFRAMAWDMQQFKTPFESALATAAAMEVERVYKARGEQLKLWGG